MIQIKLATGTRQRDNRFLKVHLWFIFLSAIFLLLPLHRPCERAKAMPGIEWFSVEKPTSSFEKRFRGVSLTGKGLQSALHRCHWRQRRSISDVYHVTFPGHL